MLCIDGTNYDIPEDGVLAPKHVGVFYYKFTRLIFPYFVIMKIN